MQTYRVKRGDSLLRIADNFNVDLNALLSVNPRLKADPNRIGVGDTLAIPAAGGRPEISPALPQATPAEADAIAGNWFSVPVGELTFDAEGMEKPGSRFHSRVLHVPTASSGVTIGRGYDMKQRSREGILSDLLAAGVVKAAAQKMARCSGLSGKKARDFIRDNELGGLEITPEAQYRLFLVVYEEIAGDVIRICTKADVVHKYGETDWEGLDPVVRDIAVDLRYRGDYTPATRKKFQPILVANSRSRLKTLMANAGYWRDTFGVPADRFQRRKKYAS